MPTPRQSPPVATDNGHVVAVRGPVLDITFDGALPELREAVVVTAGDSSLLTEVQAHLNDTTVRVTAMQPTGGLARGAAARRTHGPMTTPVKITNPTAQVTRLTSPAGASRATSAR